MKSFFIFTRKHDLFKKMCWLVFHYLYHTKRDAIAIIKSDLAEVNANHETDLSSLLFLTELETIYTLELCNFCLCLWCFKTLVKSPG